MLRSGSHPSSRTASAPGFSAELTPTPAERRSTRACSNSIPPPPTAQQLSAARTRNITLNSVASNNAAGTAPVLGATAAYNYNLAQPDLNRITASSVGTVALAGGVSDSNNLNFTGYSNLTFGASGTSPATYSGTLTPNGGTVYMLGGGGGTLSFNAAITSGSLIAGLPNGVGSAGTVVLGGPNAFSGGISINSFNTLAANVGSTTPFGSPSNTVVINNGTLVLNADPTNNLSQSIGTLTSNGDQSVVKINSASTGSVVTTLNIGSLSLPAISTQNSISTGANGSLFFNTGSSSSLNTSVFNFTGTAPTIANGILSPSLIGQLSGATSTAGDFLTLSGTDLAQATYTALPLAGPGSNTTVYNVTTGSTLTGNASAFAVKVGTATTGYTLSAGTKVLTIGDGVNTAGVILNSGSTLTSGTGGSVLLASPTVFYTNGSSTLSAVLAGGTTQGTTAVTYIGPGVATPNGTDTYTGNTVIGGSVALNADSNFGADPSSLVSNDVTLLDGANLEGQSLTLNANRGVLLAGGTISPSLPTTA